LESDFVGEWINKPETSLVINPLNTWWTYVLSLELVERLIAKGDRVIFVDVTSRKNHLIQNKIDRLFRKVLRGMNQSVRVELKKKTNFIELNLDKFTATKELENLELISSKILVNNSIENFLIGKYKKTIIHTKKYTKERKNLKKQSLILISCLEDIFKEKNFDTVYSINDRHFIPSIVFNYCKFKNKNYRIVYWGSQKNKLFVYKNSLFCDSEWKSNVIKFSRLSKTQTKFPKLKTTQYKTNKIKLGNIEHLFQKRVVVFFPNSNWEYSTLVDKKNDENYFNTQLDAFRKITQTFEKNEWNIILRHHPQKFKDYFRAEMNLWSEFRNIENVFEIGPLNKLKSTEIAKKADVNFVWTSNLGLELNLTDIPCIAMGPAPWVSDTWINSIRNSEDLIKFDYVNMKPEPKSEIFLWINYVNNFGSRFRYVEENGIDSKYSNQRIYGSIFRSKFFLLSNNVKMYLNTIKRSQN
jgi:hypothetical protein